MVVTVRANDDPGVRRRADRNLRRRLRRKAARMLRALGLERARPDLSILLAGDETLAELNRSWRKKRGPTDVLSFPQLPPAALRERLQSRRRSPALLLGDIVISLPYLARRSRNAKTFERDCETMIAHGLLHLLGYDHATKAEERVMFALQDELLDVARARGAVATIGW